MHRVLSIVTSLNWHRECHMQEEMIINQKKIFVGPKRYWGRVYMRKGGRPSMRMQGEGQNGDKEEEEKEKGTTPDMSE